MNPELDQISRRLKQFAAERDWTRFHAPKNLAAALVVEAGELLEHFQWMPEDESRQLAPDKLAQVEEEIADVFLYLMQLSDALGVDLLDAARRKIERNAEKYPAGRP
jgi:NTP pyrophosphatase (non-canonical NTP hydrolase)